MGRSAGCLRTNSATTLKLPYFDLTTQLAALETAAGRSPAIAGSAAGKIRNSADVFLWNARPHRAGAEVLFAEKHASDIHEGKARNGFLKVLSATKTAGQVRRLGHCYVVMR